MHLQVHRPEKVIEGPIQLYGGRVRLGHAVDVYADALLTVFSTWAKEGKEVDWQRLMLPKGFRVLSCRWVVERTFAWISHNRRMAKDYERLCATSEAFIYVAMTRLMVRRLARAKPFSDTISRQFGE